MALQEFASSSKETTTMSTEEQNFIRAALDSVEKAERIQRVKQIIITVLAFMAAFWLASQASSHDLSVECVVITGVGLIARGMYDKDHLGDQQEHKGDASGHRRYAKAATALRFRAPV
jgi:hypothetical protein